MITLLIRLRGRIGIRKDVKDTFKMLRLRFSNSCVLLPENKIYTGMINKVKDYSTFGLISDDVLNDLLMKRLKRKDKKQVDKKLIEKVIKTISKGKLLKDVEEVVPFLTLSPPKGGFEKKGTKKSIKQGGALGKRESIDSLVKRMM